MDFSKKKVRLGVERLEVRDVPAQLGLVAALPAPTAPAVEVARYDLGQGGETGITIDSTAAGKVQMQDLNFVMKVNRPSPQLRASSEAGFVKIEMENVLVSGY